jgi:integrase
MSGRQRGSVFKKTNGTWSYRYRTSSGRRPQRGGFRTQADAQRALNRELSRLGSGRYTGERIKFADLAERFMDQYEAAPATVKRNQSMLKGLGREFGTMWVESITSEHVAQWRATVSPGSRHSAHALLRQVLGFGVRIGCLHDNVAKEVKNKISPAKERLLFDSWDDVFRVSEELPDWAAAIPIVGAGTGLRPEEWVALRWCDIDEKGLAVCQTFTEDGGLQPYGKTPGSLRRVPLRSIVREALDGLDQSGELVFPAPRGGFIRMRKFRPRHWNPAVEAAGLPPIPPYGLRHSFASWALAAGMSTFHLARRMGTSVQMIDQTYGHLVSGADDDDIARLDRYDRERIG